MDVLIELQSWVQEGFYTTVICMFLFWFLPIQNLKKKWQYELVMRLIIVAVSCTLVWLSSETIIFEWTKIIWKQAFTTLAFSVLFYEFAGKFIVKKWFQNYKVDKSTMS